MANWIDSFPLANDKTPIELSSQDGKVSNKNSSKGRSGLAHLP